MKFFYVTSEPYPTFRVDLTELFSKGIAQNKHCKIDWHMPSLNKSKSLQLELNTYERVFVGRSDDDTGFISTVFNKLYGILHDINIYNLVKKENYDFVQVRDKVFAALIGLVAAKRKRIPFYYWLSFPHAEANVVRASDPEMVVSKPVRWFYFLRGKLSMFILYKIIFPRADYIFVQSDRMLEDVAAQGINRSKMMPVPMGINLDNICELNLKVVDDPRLIGKKVLIYLGTMARDRRIEFLVDMMPQVIEKVPEVLLLMVGDASAKDMAVIRDRVAFLGLQDKVLFTGFIPMKEGWSYIRRADVCLSPFRPSIILDSTSPTKLVEYMAWGRPVVANKHPDQSKVIDGSGAGYAVDYDIDSFANACIQLLLNKDLAEEMGEKGVEYVRRNRSYEILTTILYNKYIELLND